MGFHHNTSQSYSNWQELYFGGGKIDLTHSSSSDKLCTIDSELSHPTSGIKTCGGSWYRLQDSQLSEFRGLPCENLSR